MTYYKKLIEKNSMPFVKPDLNTIQPSFNIPEFEENSKDYLLSQTFKNGLVLENELGSIANNKARGNGFRDPNFDLYEEFSKLPERYSLSENIARMFYNAENKEHFDAIKQQIDDQTAREQYNAEAGWKGTVGYLAAGLLSPFNLLPIGTAVKSVRGVKSVLEGGIRTATMGAAAIGASEAVLQSQQEARSLGESAANVAVGTLLSGILGTALHAKLAKNPKYNSFKEQFEKEMEYPSDMIQIEDLPKTSASVGAAAAPQKSLAELMDDNTLIREKAFKFLKFQDPGFRLAMNDSLNARLYLQDIAAFDPKFKKTLKGEAQTLSVETEVLQDLDELSRIQVRKNDLFGAYKLRVGKQPNRLSIAEFNEEVFTALSRNGVSEIPEVSQAASAYRKIYNKYGNEGIVTGMFKDADNIKAKMSSYVPQSFNKSLISQNPEEFKTILVEKIKEDYATATTGQKAQLFEDFKEFKDESYFQDLADDIYRNVLGTQTGDIVKGVSFTSQPKYAKTKKLDFDYETELGKRFLKFVDRDIDIVTRNYVNTMSRRTKLIRRFGLDFIEDNKVSRKSKIVQAISNDYKALKAASIKNPKKHAAILKQEEKTLNDVFGLRDRLLGTFGYSLNPDSWAYRAQKQVKQLNMVTLLGDVTASSTPDLGKLIAEDGATKFLTRGLIPLVKTLVSKDFKKYMKENFKEVSRLSSGIEFVQGGRVNAISDVMDDFGRHTKFERAFDVISQKAISVTGLRHWNAALKEMSGYIINGAMIDAMEALAKNKASNKQISNLARSGISKEDAIKIYDNIKKHGIKEGSIILPQMSEWTGKDAARLAKIYGGALRKDMDRTIVTPGISTTPFWTSEHGLTLLGQFQSFGFSTMQKTFVPMIQDFDTNTLQGLTVMLSLGTLVAAYKRAASGQPMPDTATLIQEGVDRSGVLGWLMDANSRLEKISQGKLGLSGILNTHSQSKYYGYGTAAVLGPTSGQIDNIMGIASDVLSNKVDQRTVHAMRKLVILQNMIGFRSLFDKAEENINGLLGIPKSK